MILINTTKIDICVSIILNLHVEYYFLYYTGFFLQVFLKEKKSNIIIVSLWLLPTSIVLQQFDAYIYLTSVDNQFIYVFSSIYCTRSMCGRGCHVISSLTHTHSHFHTHKKAVYCCSDLSSHTFMCFVFVKFYSACKILMTEKQQ